MLVTFPAQVFPEVIYVQPVAAADEFIIAVSYERTVNIFGSGLVGKIVP